MKPYKLFFYMILAASFLSSSCGNDSAAKENQNAGNQTTVKKVDACTLIGASEISEIFNTKLEQLGETTWLEAENDFYHYVALCGFTNSNLMITIKLAQRKTSTEPAKSRDISHKIQKEDVEKIVFVESMDINGLPALYYEEYDKDIDLTMPVLILYTEQFDTSLVSSTNDKKLELIKAAEKVAEAVKKI